MWQLYHWLTRNVYIVMVDNEQNINLGGHCMQTKQTNVGILPLNWVAFDRGENVSVLIATDFDPHVGDIVNWSCAHFKGTAEITLVGTKISETTVCRIKKIP